MRVFDQLKFSGTPFAIDELVDKLKGREERPVLIVECLDKRIKRQVNLKLICKK